MIWKRRQQTGKRRDTWFSGAGCAAVGGILFLIGLCAYFALGHVLVRSTERKVARLEQHIRDAGQPLTLEEWDAYYPAMPDEDNAALVYEQAFTVLDEIDPEGGTCAALCSRLKSPEGRDGSESEVFEDIEVFLGECEEVIRLLDLAATRPRARYPVNLREYRLQTFRHLRMLLRCAKLETLRTAHAIQKGRQWEAVASQKNFICMADSVRDEPVLGSQTTRTSLLVLQVMRLESELNRAYLYPETLAEFEQFYLERGDAERRMLRSMAGERCLQAVKLRSRAGLQGTTPLNRMLGYFDPAGQVARNRLYDQRQYYAMLKAYGGFIDLADESWEDRMVYVTDLRENGKGWLESAELKRHPFYFTLWAIEQMAFEVAALRIGRLAIAVERYRSDNGELPAHADLLLPEYLSNVPLDPFDGQPLRYIALDKGYAIYSVLFDREDGGGIGITKVDDSVWKGDWLFVVRQ